MQPGPTQNEGTAGMTEDLDTLASQAPAGRATTPREITEAIAYPAGDAASFVHGVVLPVDGGCTAVRPGPSPSHRPRHLSTNGTASAGHLTVLIPHNIQSAARATDLRTRRPTWPRP
ncbi:SDR family oxidoreductase [Streptomyces sp. NPDC048665]|uniref:SDR family oxidoreductase n=1 Tax=Streptomyces sp. NPDC048665 TaxID=3155490 RepID=UPI0034240C15